MLSLQDLGGSDCVAAEAESDALTIFSGETLHQSGNASQPGGSECFGQLPATVETVSKHTHEYWGIRNDVFLAKAQANKTA